MEKKQGRRPGPRKGPKRSQGTYRILPSIKSAAGKILKRIGLPESMAIQLFYRQIIIHKGLPFSLHDSLEIDEIGDEEGEDEENPKPKNDKKRSL